MPLPDLDGLLRQVTYPGDTPEESAILRAWLAVNGPLFDRIVFDLRLGHGITPDPTLTPKFQQLTRQNSQKRVDAMLWDGDQGLIVEVKKRASLGAVGQISGYRLLYMAEHPEEPEPKMRIVCLTIDNDVAGVAGAHGISVDVVTL